MINELQNLFFECFINIGRRVFYNIVTLGKEIAWLLSMFVCYETIGQTASNFRNNVERIVAG